MNRAELEEFLLANPFEPFRIKLVNGDYFDLFDPQSAAVRRASLYIASSDGNWAWFPFNKINSIESLLADFQGELAHFAVNP